MFEGLNWKAAARRSAMRMAPGTARARAAAARRERGLFLDTGDGDGMATLPAYLPAEETYTAARAHQGCLVGML